MSFVKKNQNTAIYIKLTTYGRKQISLGRLNFKNFTVGDSEIDYSINENYVYGNSHVLRPFDRNIEDIKYPILYDDSTNAKIAFSGITNTEKLVINSAPTRGFFYVDGNNYTLKNDLYKTSGICRHVSDNTFNITSIGNINDLSQGDLVMMRLNNTHLTLTNPNVYSGNTTGTTTPLLWFKVVSKASTIITVDRVFVTGSTLITPNVTNIPFYVYPSGNAIDEYFGEGDSSPYWDDASMNLSGVCTNTYDVPVWNYNIVYKNTMEGTNGNTYEQFDKYGSVDYRGFKVLTDYYENKMIGILHYSNNTINNYYAESLQPSNQIIDIPYLMFHKKTTMGIKIVSDTETKFLSLTMPTGLTSGHTIALKYHDLYIDGFEDQIIGKCFNDMKLFVIEDEELATALSYKSNRNWTLPQIQGGLSNAGSNTALITNNDQVLYVTYMITTDNYPCGIHCQKIQKYQSTSELDECLRPIANSVYIMGFDDVNDFRHLNSNISNNGVGFVGKKLFLLMQRVESKDIEPDPSSWKMIEVTGTTLTNVDGYLTASGITNTFKIIDGTTYNNAPIYDLNTYIRLPLLTQPDNLQFGDENFFFGNITTNIEAVVEQTNIYVYLQTNKYTKSLNPTWDDSKDYVIINEVGIYDDNDELVMMGKLAKPIKKKTDQDLTIILSIDF